MGSRVLVRKVPASQAQRTEKETAHKETSGVCLGTLIIWHRSLAQRRDIFKDFFKTLTSPPAPLRRKWLPGAIWRVHGEEGPNIQSPEESGHSTRWFPAGN